MIFDEKPAHLTNTEYARNLQMIADECRVSVPEVVKARRKGCVSMVDFRDYFKRRKHKAKAVVRPREWCKKPLGDDDHIYCSDECRQAVAEKAKEGSDERRRIQD